MSGVLFAGALSLLFVTVPQLGNRTLIVRSGSMEPAISVGDLIVVRSSDGPFEIGDVIAYRNPGKRTMVVTHRIVEVLQGEKGREYITKGDANDVADNYVVSEELVLGDQWLAVPIVGRIFAFARTKLGFLSLIVVPSAIVVLSEVCVIWRELRRNVPKLERARVFDLAPTPGKQSSSIPSEAANLFAFIGVPPPPVRLYVDSLSRRLVLFIVAVSVLFPVTNALYVDSEITEGNVFTASDDFGDDGLADHVVISEIQLRAPGTGNADKDFVELYNPTDLSIDISGWRLRNRTSSGTQDPDLIQFPASTSIAAHSFLLWSNSNNGYAESVGADAQSTEAIADNNSIALTMSDGTTVTDGVGWGSLSNAQYTEGTVPSTLATSKSYERKALPTSGESDMEAGGIDEFKGNGFDSDTNSADFIIRDNPDPQNSGSATETP